jgi:hypothetical protein
MICQACAVGLYEECTKPAPGPLEGWIFPCGMLAEGTAAAVKQRESRFLEPDELSDDTSAGRKRAAMAAPILNGMECEWAGLLYAGGGVVPIVGCAGNRIAKVKSTKDAKELGCDEVGHIHHGPDKSVINNSPGLNLHRICTTCHNRWHALNDEFYPAQRPHPSIPFIPTSPYFAHDPGTPANDSDLRASHVWWSLPKDKRGPFPAPPAGRLRLLLPMSEPTGSVATANVFEENGDSE